MNRRKLLPILLFFSSVAIALPAWLAWGYCEHRALAVREEFLADASRNSLARADRTYQDAFAALKEMEAQHWTACSPAHIEAMRLTVFNHLSISEIGFINGDNLLACTSWGMVNRIVARGNYNFIRRDGVGIHLGLKPIIVRGDTTMAVRWGMHNALVNPKRLLDVASEKDLSVALANEDGHVVATLNSPPLDVVRYAIAHPHAAVLGSYLYASSREDGWIVVAIEDRHLTHVEASHLAKLLMPLALLVSALLVALIFSVTRRRLSPLAALRSSVQNREFMPHYQPIVDLATRRCVGAEALVRWRQPDGTLLTPEFFMPLAEESGLVERITDLMIEQVLQDMAVSLRENPALHITINISRRDVETGRPLPLLAALLQKEQLPASCIWLEATERGFIDAEAARTTLGRARQQGHIVAIDDFGTGYSSLGLLHSLPLDVLKIDRLFVEAIATDALTGTVIENIIEIAKGLRLDIIAEGIETEPQVDYLRNHGVAYGQGYLFAKPMPKLEFLTFYRNQSDHRVAKTH